MLAAVTEVAPPNGADGGPPAGATGGKGRPTPKRRDAQKRRRTPAPTNRKEAAKLRRERVREQRAEQRKALLTGDERHLPARDAGPAKRLARDVVDSRFSIGQIFFVLIIVVFVVSLVIPHQYKSVLAAVNLLSFAAVIIVFLDAVRVGRKAKRMVATAYDERSAVGITVYAAIRSMQPRRLRRPPPKVKRGEGLDKR